MRTSSLHSRGSDDALGQWLSSGSVVRPHRRENELVSEDHPLLTTSAPSDDEWESLSAFDRSEPLCNILEENLTAACRAPPVALLPLALAAVTMLRRDPPEVLFKRVSVTRRAQVRQRDPSLSFNWHDEPPQDIRAPLQNLLHKALALVIVLLRLVTTLLQLSHHPGIDLITLQPVARPARSPHHYAWQLHVPSLPQQSQLFFVW